MSTVLIAQDEKGHSIAPFEALQQHGYVMRFMNIHEATRKGYPAQQVDSIVIGQALATSAQYDTINTLKSCFDAPLMVALDEDNEDLQSLMLELGADDVIPCMAKPRLWRARLDALVRKHPAISAMQSETPDELHFGQLYLNLHERSVSLKKQPVSLTSHEFELLWLLASRAPDVVSREDIYKKVVGQHYQANSRTVDVRVSCLRRKLGDTAVGAEKIKTVWRKGYLFVKDAW
ncbi:DNA-binding response regulator [Pseudoalteromonas rubra]|uniref:DNA-binding response regulator n=1 Tax=Pseudoalteromonas rubra TaxID=43658 RepID=A0A5S3V1K0_9GAMM|nr:MULTISPECIES: response regulator transcription factor [Pseudoalteromonas]MEC4087402.1 response regulator transcription factor [Pseudoalteromonas rubra]QPB83892.1 DNA-binding response regulator [Pseudoalteromonas rubra]